MAEQKKTEQTSESKSSATSFDQSLTANQLTLEEMLSRQNKLMKELENTTRFVGIAVNDLTETREAQVKAERSRIEAEAKYETASKDHAAKLAELGKQLEEAKKGGASATSTTAQKLAEKVGEKSIEKLFEELNKAKSVEDARKACNSASQEFLKKMREDKALEGEVKEQISFDKPTFYWGVALAGLAGAAVTGGVAYVCYEKGRERGHTDMMDATVTVHSRGESNGVRSGMRH